jgi:hypothetical protein
MLRAPLIGFDAYRQREREVRDAATTPSGVLLEYGAQPMEIARAHMRVHACPCARLSLGAACLGLGMGRRNGWGCRCGWRRFLLY